MLLPLVVSIGLAALGVMLIAVVAHTAMRRLNLELVSVLLWLGLAEARADELAVRRGAQPSFGKSAFGGRSL